MDALKLIKIEIFHTSRKILANTILFFKFLTQKIRIRDAVQIAGENDEDIYHCHRLLGVRIQHAGNRRRR